MGGAVGRDNPQSPLNVYKDGTTVRVQIRSITFLKLGSGKENIAQVRFTKYARTGRHRRRAGRPLDLDDRVRLHASRRPTTSCARSIRSGFRIVEYRREPEVATLPQGKAGQP